MPPFAVHLSDWVLSTPVIVIGFIVAALLLLPALWRVDEEEIPRIGLLTAAFFVASSIHVKVGPTSVHLLLNALVGVALGRRAALAVSVGLVMQVALLAHGGWTTLGINAAMIGGPALVAGFAFRALAWGKPTPRRVAWIGGLIGGSTVLMTAAICAALLILGGVADFTVIALPQFTVYLVLAAIEGVIVGVTAGFLARVKPELLGLTSSPPRTGS